MRESIKFRVFFITGPDWKELSAARRAAIARSVAESPLFGKEPDRYGFAKVRRVKADWIIGFFTQEFKTRRHKYDDAKHEHPYTDEPFEDSLTILLLDQGIAFLQSRRFRDESISMGDVLQNFDRALRSILKPLEIPYYGLEPYIVKYDKEAFLRLFSTEYVLEVDVTSMLNRPVPEDFTFYNPEVEKNKIVKEFVTGEFHSLDELTARSTEDGAGLQSSKLAKVALTVGEPREITIKERGTRVLRTIRRQVGPTHTIELAPKEINPTAIARDLDRFFSRRGGRLVRQKTLDVQVPERDASDEESESE